MQTYENVLVDVRGNVGLITLNRAKGLNTLSTGLFRDLNAAIDVFESNPAIGCIVVTGSERAFAAGGDVKEMVSRDYVDVYLSDFVTADWERIASCRKPVIAAVQGLALGGGCEIAMMCDFIIAADTAKFGQPEISLGTVPGCGGTQRLTRLIGKSKAMDLCLTGRLMDAAEAERCGLVSRVVPAPDLLEEAIAAAAKIAKFSVPVVMMAKECVNRAYETTLAEGLRFERRVFHSTFALSDRREGMTAFIEKRPANFTGR